MKRGATLVGAIVATMILSISFIAILDLQAGIIKAQSNNQYDNTANLLMSEGLEIVRAIYQSNLNDTGTWNKGLADGTYAVDYKTTNIKNGLTVTSTCNTGLNNSCSLVQNPVEGYILGNGNLLYRYITVLNATDKITVTSTVIVNNPRLNTKIYSANIEIFNTFLTSTP
jgi:hypothetical protein